MEEKKVYSVVGTVTIGTDEYRDLIEDKISAEKQTDSYRDRYWTEQSKVKELENQINLLKTKLERCEKFIKKNTVNISEDGINVFMSLFGEE